MEQMVITIKDGSTMVEVERAHGTHCVEMTQAIEKLIGDVESRLLKKDFYIGKKVRQNLYVKQFNNGKSL